MLMCHQISMYVKLDYKFTSLRSLPTPAAIYQSSKLTAPVKRRGKQTLLSDRYQMFTDKIAMNLCMLSGRWSKADG